MKFNQVLLSYILNEYSQELYYLNYMCSKLSRRFRYTCFSIITGKHKKKNVNKDVLCECKCKFDRRKFNSNQKRITINIAVTVKHIKYVKKCYISTTAICKCANEKYLAGIINNDSVVTCDKIIEELKNLPSK